MLLYNNYKMSRFAQVFMVLLKMFPGTSCSAASSVWILGHNLILRFFSPLPGRVFRLCMVGVVVFPENPMLSSVTEPSVNEWEAQTAASNGVAVAATILTHSQNIWWHNKQKLLCLYKHKERTFFMFTHHRRVLNPGWGRVLWLFDMREDWFKGFECNRVLFFFSQNNALIVTKG